jgi:hypothetical protein
MDAYCERTGPGLLAEPLNAITNSSFLIAAWFAWFLAHRLGRISPGVLILIWLSVSVGIGSALWHTYATAGTLILDIIPILIFLVWFFWLYMRTVARMPTPWVLAIIAAFLVTSTLAERFAGLLHGALYYTPALILLLALGVLHARKRAAARYTLLVASGVYALALFFRTIDLEVCSAIPIGTHFLWHSLNGLAAYLAMRCVILSRASRVGVLV